MGHARRPRARGAVSDTELRWSTVPFGAQANPLSDDVDVGVPCGDGAAQAVLDAQLLEVGDDALHDAATYRYANVAACSEGGVPACELVFEVRCARAR